MKKKLARWLDHHMLEVLRGAMVAFPLRVLAAGLTFALNIMLARILGVEDTGLYFLALTITTIATTIGTLGLGNVLVRHTAAGAEQDDLDTVKAVARAGTRAALLCAVGLTILLASTAGWLSEFVLGKPELATPLRWIALTIVPQTQLMLHAQLLRGLKKIAISQFLRNIDVPVLTMVFLVVLGDTFGVTGAVWSYSLASLITAGLAFWVWRRAVGPDKAVSGTVSLQDLLRSGFPLLQSNLMNLLVNSATVLMLGAMSTSTAVALYGVAFRTAMLTRFAQMAVNSMAGPKFAALHSMADAKALGTTARRSAFLVALFATPMLLVLMLFPEWIMSLFGEKFVEGANVLIILAVGHFIAVFSGSVAYLLMMSGNERLLRNNNAIAAVVNLLLNVALIPEFGATGAAISVSTAIFVRNALSSLQVYRQLGILPFFIPVTSERLEDV